MTPEEEWEDIEYVSSKLGWNPVGLWQRVWWGRYWAPHNWD